MNKMRLRSVNLWRLWERAASLFFSFIFNNRRGLCVLRIASFVCSSINAPKIFEIMSDRDSDRSARVYVGGLTDSVKKEDLECEFEKYGKLNSVWVAFNPPGFAFIEFNSHSDAETACDNLNGTDFLGSKLRVEIARGKSRRGGGGGFRGGRGRGGAPYRGSSGGGSGGYGDRGFRGSSRGGRPGGRFDGYSSSGGGSRRDEGSRYGRDFSRRSEGGSSFGRSDSYNGRGSSGGGGGGGRRFESSRFRSRSPASGPPRH